MTLARQCLKVSSTTLDVRLHRVSQIGDNDVQATSPMYFQLQPHTFITRVSSDGQFLCDILVAGLKGSCLDCLCESRVVSIPRTL